MFCITQNIQSKTYYMIKINQDSNETLSPVESCSSMLWERKQKETFPTIRNSSSFICPALLPRLPDHLANQIILPRLEKFLPSGIAPYAHKVSWKHCIAMFFLNSRGYQVSQSKLLTHKLPFYCLLSLTLFVLPYNNCYG